VEIFRQPGEFARVGVDQTRDTFLQNAFAGIGARGFAFERQPFKMLRELHDLKQHRARIFVVEQHEIKNRRNVRQ